jgi:nitroreductase
MNIIEVLQSRYAVKKFDLQKKVSEAQIQNLLEAANLTATSYGLQPYKILNIKDKIIREKISDASFGQRQPVEASHLFIIAVRTDIDEDYVMQHAKYVCMMRGTDKEQEEKYKAMLLGFIRGLHAEQRQIWAMKQCYIVLGNLLTCCALEQIDSCPMEGFSSGKVDEILQLKERNLHAVVMLPVGYRSSIDKYQYIPKVRKTISDIVIEI